MNSSRGIFGVPISSYNENEVVAQCINTAKDQKMVKAGQKIAMVFGTNEDAPDESNVMKIMDA